MHIIVLLLEKMVVTDCVNCSDLGKKNSEWNVHLETKNLLLKDDTSVIIQDGCRHKRVSCCVRMKPESVKLANVHFIGLANRILSWSKNIQIWQVHSIVHFIYLSDCPGLCLPYSMLQLNTFLVAHSNSCFSLKSGWLDVRCQRPTKLPIYSEWCMRFDFLVMSALMFHWYLLTFFQLHRLCKGM